MHKAIHELNEGLENQINEFSISRSAYGFGKWFLFLRKNKDNEDLSMVPYP